MSGPGQVTGAPVVGGRGSGGGGRSFRAADPRSGAELEPPFRDASAADVDRVCVAAAAAAAAWGAASAATRAALLRGIGRHLQALGPALLARAGAETGLPEARLVAERGRTIAQLEMFAALLEDGSWVDARIDRAQPDRQPQPRPDLRSMLRPLGPVAVFGASNFPLAFSVAGGDTASALAAGCPVVAKGHPAHPGTSELAARAILAAAAELGLPEGVFAMVQGRGDAVGAALVRHPTIAAVGFTGSRQGGRALWDLAAARPDPIPVCAELGSANPVFVLPGALAERGGQIAAALAASATLAAGQFCTSPGIAVLPDGEAADAFVGELGAALERQGAGLAVHAGIASAFAAAVAEVCGLQGVRRVAGGTTAAATGSGAAMVPVLLETTAAALLTEARLGEEIYGPCVLAVRCRDAGEVLAVAARLRGHLTATVHASAAEQAQQQGLLAVLLRNVGRVVWNGVPTGVEVCAAMHHGGPWPAATDARFTSVGSGAIRRWCRPACWQDVPAALLPPELQDANPLGLWRTIEGRLDRH